jgi:hypothetical protein
MGSCGLPAKAICGREFGAMVSCSKKKSRTENFKKMFLLLQFMLRS